VFKYSWDNINNDTPVNINNNTHNATIHNNNTTINNKNNNNTNNTTTNKKKNNHTTNTISLSIYIYIYIHNWDDVQLGISPTSDCTQALVPMLEGQTDMGKLPN
jgi:hypothetical protein